MKTYSIILSGLLVGAAAAITATLLAPDKGKKTRKKLTKKGQKYVDYLLDSYEDLAGSVTHPFEDLQDQTIRLSKKAIKKAEKVKAEAIEKAKF